MKEPHGRLEIVQELERRGANVDATDSRGWTPMHLAVALHHIDIVRELGRASLGADPNTENNDGNTPLHLAGKPPTHVSYLENKFFFVRTLVEAGADPRIAQHGGGFFLYETPTALPVPPR